ncbi:uncharacterized protein [Nicotiana sylvestris]|uniref:uncharacterized protein n=1 Tax=Nicotiana sylvestris TaxID=4096 RepID=UPI00388C7756
MDESKEIDTPIATTTKLDLDEHGSSIDQKLYRGMIGSLLYLTASRPDIVFSIGLCACFQANPKESHLTVVKRILRYLKGTTDLCLCEGEGPESSDSKKAQKSPSEVSSSLTENLENRFVLVGPIRDVELPELRRSEGKKKFEKEKEKEGECGDVRGKWKGVADYSPTVVPAICGVAQEIAEESGKKLGGSGSSEVAEGLVNLSSQGDKPGSSVEETLADLLKKVGASYNPKKRRTLTPKAPSAPKPSKKRKASSPTPTKTSLPKGRATRSRVKQSESDLQKALAESKKKRMDKGKGKVVESSENVDVEEMERFYQEKVTTVEVPTPKPKKPKTSSKKSSSMFEAPETSLAKRTRSAVKSKQVRVSEDEEWSGDEESESGGEQDKLAMFGKRNFLKGYGSFG